MSNLSKNKVWSTYNKHVVICNNIDIQNIFCKIGVHNPLPKPFSIVENSTNFIFNELRKLKNCLT